MSGTTFALVIKDDAVPLLRRFRAGLTDATGLHEAIGKDVANAVRDYLIELAESKHRTAERLGASPSGHLAKAAEKTTFAADQSAARITVKA